MRTPKPNTLYRPNMGHPHMKHIVVCYAFLERCGKVSKCWANPTRWASFGFINSYPNANQFFTQFNGLQITTQGTNFFDCGIQNDLNKGSSFGNDITIIFRYRKTDTTLRNNDFMSSQNGTVSQRIYTTLPWSDGNIYFDYGGASDGTTRITQSYGTPYDRSNIFCFTNGARGNKEVWFDQRKIKSGSTRTSPASESDNYLLFGGGLGNDADLAQLEWFRMYDRQISEQQILAIMRDEWGPWDNRL